MTVMSMPACSSDMAAEWRMTWGVTCLAAIDGQVRAAVVACLATRCSTASRLRRVPRRDGNSGSGPAPPRSASQPRRMSAVAGGERGRAFLSALMATLG